MFSRSTFESLGSDLAAALNTFHFTTEVNLTAHYTPKHRGRLDTTTKEDVTTGLEYSNIHRSNAALTFVQIKIIPSQNSLLSGRKLQNQVHMGGPSY